MKRSIILPTDQWFFVLHHVIVKSYRSFCGMIRGIDSSYLSWLIEFIVGVASGSLAFHLVGDPVAAIKNKRFGHFDDIFIIKESFKKYIGKMFIMQNQPKISTPNPCFNYYKCICYYGTEKTLRINEQTLHTFPNVAGIFMGKSWNFPELSKVFLICVKKKPDVCETVLHPVKSCSSILEINSTRCIMDTSIEYLAI